MRFSPDGKALVVAADNGKVRFWDISSPARLDSLPVQPEPISSISLSSDGELLAVASRNHEPRFWNLRSSVIHRERLKDVPADVVCLSFALIGRKLAAARADGSVLLIEPSNPKQSLNLAGPGPSIGGLVFSRDGRLLAGGSVNLVRIWDTTTGQELRSLPIAHHDPGHQRMAVSSDVRCFAFQSANEVKCWDVSQNKLIDLRTGHSHHVRCLSFTPDGQILATGSDDMHIKLWETRTFRELATLRGHRNDVKCLAFSPDGRILASGGQDRFVRIWDMATKQELFSLAGHTDIIRHLAFTPDGQTLVTVGDAADGTKAEIRFWHAPH